MKTSKLLSRLFNICDDFKFRRYLNSDVVFNTKDEINVWGDTITITYYLSDLQVKMNIDDIQELRVTPNQIRFITTCGVKIAKIF